MDFAPHPHFVATHAATLPRRTLRRFCACLTHACSARRHAHLNAASTARLPLGRARANYWRKAPHVGDYSSLTAHARIPVAKEGPLAGTEHIRMRFCAALLHYHAFPWNPQRQQTMDCCIKRTLLRGTLRVRGAWLRLSFIPCRSRTNAYAPLRVAPVLAAHHRGRRAGIRSILAPLADIRRTMPCRVLPRTIAKNTRARFCSTRTEKDIEVGCVLVPCMYSLNCSLSSTEPISLRFIYLYMHA